MDSHTSIHPSKYEEKMTLLDEKSLSNVEGDAGRVDLFTRTRQWTSHARSVPHNLRSILLRTGFFLLPSFIQPYVSRDPRSRASTSSRHLSPTAYLDGMRGLAALFVYFCHYSYTSYIIAPGYGYVNEEKNIRHYYFLSLPFIRLFYSGPPMVCLFFIISGYALSLKPLRLIHASSRRWDAFAGTMSSFTFRRAIRLFLPPAISTLFIVLLVRVGLYEWTRDLATDKAYHRNVHEPHHHRLETTYAQLAEWAWDMFKFVHVWDWTPNGGSTAIDVHLWTIPVEFRASMSLFLVMIGTARLKTAWRFLVVLVCIAFSYRSQRWEMALFLVGMALAEMDVIRGAHESGSSKALPVTSSPGSGSGSPSPSPSPGRKRSVAKAKRAAWIAVSIIGLYLMSQPDNDAKDTPGWVYLTSLIPKWWSDQHRYWQSIGATLFMLAVGRLPGWQRVFNTALVQYFGKISYAIYLMHGPAMHTIGYAIERWAWSITGLEGKAYDWGFVLAAVFVVPAVVWVSDVFWRAVDAPVVRFAKWVEAKCTISE